MRSFYQDSLGTNIGKAQKKYVFLGATSRNNVAAVQVPQAAGVEVAVVHEQALHETYISFFSTFPMFVPSLFW